MLIRNSVEVVGPIIHTKLQLVRPLRHCEIVHNLPLLVAILGEGACDQKIRVYGTKYYLVRSVGQVPKKNGWVVWNSSVCRRKLIQTAGALGGIVHSHHVRHSRVENNVEAHCGGSRVNFCCLRIIRTLSQTDEVRRSVVEPPKDRPPVIEVMIDANAAGIERCTVGSGSSENGGISVCGYRSIWCWKSVEQGSNGGRASSSRGFGRNGPNEGLG